MCKSNFDCFSSSALCPLYIYMKYYVRMPFYSFFLFSEARRSQTGQFVLCAQLNANFRGSVCIKKVMGQTSLKPQCKTGVTGAIAFQRIAIVIIDRQLDNADLILFAISNVLVN
jgi:hypothetical protein